MAALEEILKKTQDICNRAEAVKASVTNVSHQALNITEPDIENMQSCLNTFCLTVQNSYSVNGSTISFSDEESTICINSNGMFLDSNNLNINGTDWNNLLQRLNQIEERLDAIGA